MKRAGQLILFRFPRTDGGTGKLRPALLIGRLPGKHEDWLLCMASSQLQNCVADFDEIIQPNDSDFANSGLKLPTLIRIGRLAVIDGQKIIGAIGEINPKRLERIKKRLALWLRQ